eukprot:CAMPEP_0195151678 /NCGR_PEP_ID=MMETSP0448-20130528/180989_1 /TAXON_ID=66468 /ORGANISM="Heterocapsa triquestra, Strain CCMP 448" /LENGTH=39 /DNA_ID= /DNA_START= /DNA_END= /DNA_ORIENTATION=
MPRPPPLCISSEGAALRAAVGGLVPLTAVSPRRKRRQSA